MSKIGLYWFVLSVLLSCALQIMLFLLTLSSCYTTSIRVGTAVRSLSLSRFDLFLWKISLFWSEKVMLVRWEAWPCPCLDAPGWLGGWLIEVGGTLRSAFFTHVIKRSFLRSGRLIFLYIGKYKYYPCTLNLYFDLYSRLTHHVFFFCLFSYGHLVTKIFQSYLIY